MCLMPEQVEGPFVVGVTALPSVGPQRTVQACLDLQPVRAAKGPPAGPTMSVTPTLPLSESLP